MKKVMFFLSALVVGVGFANAAPAIPVNSNVITVNQDDKEKIKALFDARDKLGCAKNALFESVVNVSAFRPGALSNKEKKKAGAFLLLAYFLSPALDGWIQKEGQKLNLSTAIDLELIDQVIVQEQANAARVQDAIERGKQLATQQA